MITLVDHTAALGRRAVMGIFRQPTVLLPGLVFPAVIAAVQSSALSRAINLPGFEPHVDSFLDFVLAATVTQGVLFGGITGGADLALDIEGGFFDRLLAAPTSRVAILLGRLAGSAAMGAVQAVAFVLLFLAFGANVKDLPVTVFFLVVYAIVLAVAVGAAAAAIGLRTGSAEAVQNCFPLVFITLFISSAFFPPSLMNGWYRFVAEHNPISLMIDGMRDQVVGGFDASSLGKALGVALTLTVISMALALAQLRRRLRVAG